MSKAPVIFKFEHGDVLFKQNDPGGDLYLIESGTVEIFTEKDDVQVILSEMNSGEIIGLLTCLDNRPRTASARAKGRVRVKKVPSEKIQKTIEELPKFVQIILKEFTNRIQGNMALLTEQGKTLENAKNERVDMVYLGKIVTATAARLAPYHLIETDRGEMVPLPPLVEDIAACLRLEEPLVNKIFEILHMWAS